MERLLRDDEVRCERARESWFWAEVLSCLPALRSYARHLARDAEAADDLVQETVLRAFQFRERYQLGTKCCAWLRTILRKLFVTRLRSDRCRHLRVGEEYVERLADPVELEGRVLGAVSSSGVRDALREVREPFRTAVAMSVVAGLTYKQIALLLDVPMGTVKSRVCRGRRLLRGRLRPQLEG